MKNTLCLSAAAAICAMLFFTCKSSDKAVDRPQPKVLEKGAGFDLEKATFRENTPILFSKHIQNEYGADHVAARDGKLTPEFLSYKITNSITDAFKLRVPQKPFGRLYKSPELDSIATFCGQHFIKLYILTDLDKNPVAFLAEGEFSDPNLGTKYIDSLTKRFGRPMHAYQISQEFSQRAYEWRLKDRTIQIETSKGFGIMSSGAESSTSSTYTKITVLIIDNTRKQALFDAHRYTMPDILKSNGKSYTLKELQLEKSITFRDEFVLYSSLDEYTNDELDLYSTSGAEEQE